MTDARPATKPERSCAGDGRRCKGHELFLYRTDDPRRDELEQFVRDAFAAKHGARVCSFMPTLLAMRNEAGNVCSVAGFRCAAEQGLFLESYLDRPVEHVVSAAAGQQINRAQIVEVGNLAGVSCRSAMRLVLELPRILIEHGHRWIVFTATDTLRQLLASYHAPLLELASATVSRAKHTADDWGRYYDTQPRVMAGYLPDGLQLGRRRVE